MIKKFTSFILLFLLVTPSLFADDVSVNCFTSEQQNAAVVGEVLSGQISECQLGSDDTDNDGSCVDEMLAEKDASLQDIKGEGEVLSGNDVDLVENLFTNRAPVFMNVALGYNHSLTNGHGVLADIALNYTPRRWVELFGGISVNTWNMYTASLRGDFRWWLSDSRNLAIRNQYLYNIYVDDNFQRFNMSLALAYDQEYFYIAAGGYAQFFTPIFSKLSERSYIWEPGFIYDIRTRIFKKNHVWNLGLQVTNILPFVIERSYIPIFVLNANYRLLGEGENNFNIFAQLACQPAGIFHISANYYSVFFKIGLSCVI